jgi:hypothetical protein
MRFCDERVGSVIRVTGSFSFSAFLVISFFAGCERIVFVKMFVCDELVRVKLVSCRL